jgi:hypothetical protein
VGSVAQVLAWRARELSIGAFDPATLMVVPLFVMAPIAAASLPALRRAFRPDAAMVLRQE